MLREASRNTSLVFASLMVDRQVRVERVARLDIDSGFDVGVGRKQELGAVNRDALARIIKYRDIGALGFIAELEQALDHLVARKIDTLDDVESRAKKFARDR